MNSAEIRSRFLEYFRQRGHEARPSSSLVPTGDPTLLFTNAGMVQFKDAFLGAEKPGFARAVTAQRCVRAGGKHNDLEEVGRTARHHTFFEMLGNFSFGDYFKREAIGFAWEFLAGEMGLDRDRLFVTVHHSDEEAAGLWSEVAGVAPERIYRLGDRDNFWQMADTGPCGPCSEVHYDLRPARERGSVPGTEEFERRGEAGEFLELWNLVFMQFDRDASGEQRPLPAPSIDTGLGLERLAAVLQGADSNYHTDLFVPLLDRVAEIVGRPYEAGGPEGVSYRVLADHARAVAFLLADGVHPSSEGRGYVLRRILRRGVRHAWLLGRREPTLAGVVEAVVERMADVHGALAERGDAIVAGARGEEERFLATIDGGMERLGRVAPPLDGPAPGSPAPERPVPSPPVPARPVISGAEVFRLYDTFGFPLDLTRIVAEERGYDIDAEGFEAALAEQRERSRAGRRGAGAGREGGAEGAAARAPVPPPLWHDVSPKHHLFVGYGMLEVATFVWDYHLGRDGWMHFVLDDHPFYAEGGGQVSDRGLVESDRSREKWSVEVREVRREGEWTVVAGTPDRDMSGLDLRDAFVVAHVDAPRRRDTERNHTATHLLHAALRAVLGDHVRQRGSLVAPDRLRFDFSHAAPLTAAELRDVTARVRDGIWASHPVRWSRRPYDEAVADGAMALFGEKYDKVVRVVDIPGVSMELCGGTHVRSTAEIGPFAITSESGVAAGVRRIEAVTGRAAFERLEGFERQVEALAASVKASPAALERRVGELMAGKAELETMVDELRRGGGDGVRVLAEAECGADGARILYRGARMKVRGPGDARSWGDGFRGEVRAGVAVAAVEMPGGKHALFAFASDGAVAAGVRADEVVREVAALVGGRGGGRPHMAQAGVADAAGLDDAVRRGGEIVERLAGRGPR